MAHTLRLPTSHPPSNLAPKSTFNLKPAILNLADARTLSYAEYGDPQGQPLMYFHGWPSSRLEAEMVDAPARRHHLRIIAPDRPGFGRSDFQSGRRLIDWPADVIELANELGLDRFSILGPSGGGPYAAVCAWKIPERLRSVGIVSGQSPTDDPSVLAGMRPLNRRLALIGRWAPWLFRPLSWPVIRALKREPDGYLARLMSDLPEPDRKVMVRAEIRKPLQNGALEAFRNGSRGAALENALYARPWGFDLGAITMEVHLWYGELDLNVPPAMGRYLASAIPNCHARFYPNEGHLSVFVNHMDEILQTVGSESRA
jgi:pimeloyl-ACP methyl ester carboxylesterase